MGRGNVNVNHDEGLFYVDYDNIYMYTNKNDETDIKHGSELNTGQMNDYEFDATMSQLEYNLFCKELVEMLTKHYKHMTAVDKWIGRSRHVIAESDMLRIAVEDNEWSIAVEILRNDTKYPHRQTRIVSGASKLIRDWLIDRFTTIHCRTGSWTSEPLDKAGARKLDKTVRNLHKYAKQRAAEDQAQNKADDETAVSSNERS